MFDTLCIVGVGLIGGSVGLAARERGLARRVVGVARNPETRRDALRLGALDEATDDLTEAVRAADCVFLATPVGAMRGVCEQIAPVVKFGALVTDGGSVKGSVVRECAPLFPQAHFVGGHPMAGSEQSGVNAARADLFEGATWVVTPSPHSLDAVSQLTQFVEALGARPLLMSPETHDQLVAVTSHLPHLTASALVHRFADARQQNADAAQLTAGGWRDGTRVASGDPALWRDICVANAPAVLSALDGIIGELSDLRLLLQRGDGEALRAWLDAAAQVRRAAL